MSWARPVLNSWLRFTEKPYLARVQDPLELRRGFEKKARLYFHAPFGTQRSWATLGDRPALTVRPRGEDGTGPTILYFHGGAYVFGSPRTHAAMLANLARQVGGSAILPDYRKAPDAPFPAAVDDARAVWTDLLQTGVDPNRVIMGGDSAGGGLALALLAQLLTDKAPLPAGLFALSPLTDMTYSGQSVRGNEAADVILPASRTGDLTELYLGAQDPADPRASPLFADFKGAPPIHLSVGTTEILRDDSIRLNDSLDTQGVEVQLELAEDLPHVWPIFHNILPEARATLERIARWVRTQTDR